MEKLDKENKFQNQLGIALEESASTLTQGTHGERAEGGPKRTDWPQYSK